MAMHSLPVLLLALFVHSSLPQQFQGSTMGMPYNVSASCMQALNTNVACPGALAEVAARWVALPRSNGCEKDPGVIIELSIDAFIVEVLSILMDFLTSVKRPAYRLSKAHDQLSLKLVPLLQI